LRHDELLREDCAGVVYQYVNETKIAFHFFMQLSYLFGRANVTVIHFYQRIWARVLQHFDSFLASRILYINNGD
jgi:hypothetical protein